MRGHSVLAGLGFITLLGAEGNTVSVGNISFRRSS
jgi:hypothetical protein